MPGGVVKMNTPILRESNMGVFFFTVLNLELQPADFFRWKASINRPMVADPGTIFPGLLGSALIQLL
jgi:hypothetical protein